MHDIGVVLTSEDEPSPAHIGGKLVHFIELPINHRLAEGGIPQVAHDEIIGLGRGKFRKLQVNAANP